MRFSITAVVAAFSSTALAQSVLSQIPKCAQTCFGGNLGSCGVADIACICGSKTIESVSCCVFATCSQSDIAETTQFAVQLCKLKNVNVNTQPSCPSSNATLSSNTTLSSTANLSSTATPSAGNSTFTPVNGSASRTASGSASPTSTSAAGSTGAASCQTAGAAVGLGIAMLALLAAL